MKSFYEMLNILNESHHDLRGYDAWLTQPPYSGERINPDDIQWDEDWIEDSELLRIVNEKFVDKSGKPLPWLDKYSQQATSSNAQEMWLTFERKSGEVTHNPDPVRYPGEEGLESMEVAIDIKNPKLIGRNSEFNIDLEDRVSSSIASHFYSKLENLSSE